MDMYIWRYELGKECRSTGIMVYDSGSATDPTSSFHVLKIGR